VATLTSLPASNVSVEMTYGDAKTTIILRLTQMITPETERTTHVFFAWSRNFLLGTEHDAGFQAQSYKIMDQDISFMPLQQQCVERFGELRYVPINADATLIEARKVVQRLLREEQEAAQRRSA
jgi:vanillate O-demethylase monooxygenase subunit